MHEDTSNDWFEFEEIRIHEPLFKKGITVVCYNPQPNSKAKQKEAAMLNSITNTVSDKTFIANSREFQIIDQSDSIKKTKEIRKVENLVNHLYSYMYEELGRSGPGKAAGPIIYNRKRRSEVFVPFIFQRQPVMQEGKSCTDLESDAGDASQSSDVTSYSYEQEAVYIYPWVNGLSFDAVKFEGFERFVTAGCLFGTSLKGVDQHGAVQPLIKHEIPFFAGQYIESIKFDSAKQHPYETVLFTELEKLASLICNLSAKDKPKQLYFHLPSIDYLLFGISLYIHERITKCALSTFIASISSKRKEYIEKINAIFTPFDISVDISSPFDNLFPHGEIPLMRAEDGEDAVNIDEIFNCIAPELLASIPDPECEEYKPTSEQDRQAREQDLVEQLLVKLHTNENNISHRDAWHDFYTLIQLRRDRPKKTNSSSSSGSSSDSSEVVDSDSVVTIEHLFKKANALILALASEDKAPLKVCSILPSSEKQIQIEYDRVVEGLAHINSKYRPVFNLTQMDPVVAYSPKNSSANLFYMREGARETSRIVRENLLTYASRNIILFANKNRAEVEPNPEPMSVRKIISSSK